jgi:hypothetical protein
LDSLAVASCWRECHPDLPLGEKMSDPLKAIIERGDYVCFLPEWATVEGRFTVEELRAIADQLEANQRRETEGGK